MDEIISSGCLENIFFRARRSKDRILAIILVDLLIQAAVKICTFFRDRWSKDRISIFF